MTSSELVPFKNKFVIIKILFLNFVKSRKNFGLISLSWKNTLDFRKIKDENTKM